MAHQRKQANLRNYPHIAIYFFHEKQRLWHENVAPLLGFTHYFGRMEYQWRMSVHEHEFLWHPGFPLLACLIRIMQNARDDARKFGEANFADNLERICNEQALMDTDAAKSAAWIARFLDASNEYWNSSEKKCEPAGRGHPCDVDPTQGGVPTELTDDLIDACKRDYAKIRTCTGRHTE